MNTNNITTIEFVSIKRIILPLLDIEKYLKYSMMKDLYTFVLSTGFTLIELNKILL